MIIVAPFIFFVYLILKKIFNLNSHLWIFIVGLIVILGFILFALLSPTGGLVTIYYLDYLSIKINNIIRILVIH